jgi:hypothetical protein
MSTQFSIFVMQTFASCEVFDKIDILPFSLYTISKGAKEWTQACMKFGLLEHKLATLTNTCFASNVTRFEQCIVY